MRGLVEVGHRLRKVKWLLVCMGTFHFPWDGEEKSLERRETKQPFVRWGWNPNCDSSFQFKIVVGDIKGEKNQTMSMRFLEGMWSKELQFKLEEAIKGTNGSSKWYFLDYKEMWEIACFEMFWILFLPLLTWFGLPSLKYIIR